MDESKPIVAFDYRIDVTSFFQVVSPITWSGRFASERQLLLNHPDHPKITNENRWTYGAGSLWDEGRERYWAHTKHFTELQPELKGTYVEDVINAVRGIAAPKKKIGRVRLLTLLPKTCYSLHTDQEEYRFHIPLRTSHSSFFVCDDQLDRMPEAGRLYLFKTNAPHTAVNAHLEESRVHLVFDTYE